MRNPSWTRDELIVTLQFYLAHTPTIPGKNSNEILELSQFLNQLQFKLGGAVYEKFRNPNGVYMKLMNFRRLDPEHESQGLSRGNKDELVVWNRFASEREELLQVSEAIRNVVSSENPISLENMVSPDEEEGEEGRALTRLHRYRERDASLVKRKKQRMLKEQQTLTCEVCEFDFEQFYGERGQGFIECHHTKPLSELSQVGGTTKLADLSLVCSNCHRMIHKTSPWLSISGLRDLLQQVQ